MVVYVVHGRLLNFNKMVDVGDNSESDGFVGDSDGYDTETELQEAFARGEIKPGLNVELDAKKPATNNVEGLKQRLADLRQNLPWIERLDVSCGMAPMAPEIAVYIAEQEARPEIKKVKTPKALDPTLDDFKRETNFHRQAQAAVLEAIPRLHELGLKTKRPDDYFAQMVKSDEHMQKIRANLLRKKAGQEVAEKVSKIRKNTKMMKQLQSQALQERQKAKKELISEVKKYRKGIRKDLDFLEPGADKRKPQQQDQQRRPGQTRKAIDKKKQKDAKYGQGGKKRGAKRNTAASAVDFKARRTPAKPQGKNKNQQRPGKAKRRNMNVKRKH